MNKLLLFALLFLSFSANYFAQSASFSDNFDSYTAGKFVAQSNTRWTTWTNKPGTAEDALVSDEQARSGKNSAKFESSDPVNGGPTDLVLEFVSAPKQAGTFTLSMWMYVVSGNGAYFNLQGLKPIGSTGGWVLSAYYYDDGTIEIGNSGNLVVGSGSYPFDTWFETKVDVDLTNNKWVMSVNGNEIGTWQSPTNSIYAIDLFPINQNGTSLYYVDDFNFSYTEPVLPKIDASLYGSTAKNFAITGGKGNLSVNVRNVGLDPITSLDLNFKNGASIKTYKATGLNIASLASASIKHPDQYTIEDGKNDLIVYISNVNGSGDLNSKNDSVKVGLTGYTPAPFKKSLVEEGTGTWCQWCPRGTVFMDSLNRTYPDHFVPIAVHTAVNGGPDPMDLPDYSVPFGSLIGNAYPRVAVNRTTITDPGTMELPMLVDLTKAPVAKLKHSGLFNINTKELTICVSTEALEAMSGDYKLNCVITEDSLKGTTSAWAQRNAYAGGANGPMGGYESLPSLVPASRMKYDHVAIATLGPIDGIPNSIPANLGKGDKVTYQFSFTLPATSRANKVQVVSYLIAPDGSIANSQITTIDELLANGNDCSVGTKDVLAANTQITLSPNPVTNQSKLEFELAKDYNVGLTVYDQTGKSIHTKNYGKLSGKQQLSFGNENLNSGVYFIQLNIGGEMKSISFFVK